MIDSHCHLADDAFADDVHSVIERAQSAGLSQALCIIAAGHAVEESRALRIADLWPAMRFGVGIHPHQAGTYEGREAEVVPIVRAAATAVPRARALGEMGLDYHYEFAPHEAQKAVFRLQLRLARELSLPVIVHTREAEEDTIAILREESGGTLRGVLHCFTGSRLLAEQALELGMHISFAGIVTFPRTEALRAVVPLVPADRLLCETDSPYLAPVPFRGKRNEPAWVMKVVEQLAALRGVPAPSLGAVLAANFDDLFGP